MKQICNLICYIKCEKYYEIPIVSELLLRVLTSSFILAVICSIMITVMVYLWIFMTNIYGIQFNNKCQKCTNADTDFNKCVRQYECMEWTLNSSIFCNIDECAVYHILSFDYIFTTKLF